MSRDCSDLFLQLAKAYAEADEIKRADFDRSLPLADVALDRWERAKRLGFGANASIYNSALVFGAPRVGENVWIGPNTILDASGGELEIGDWCSISAGVQIYTHDTVARSVTLGAVQLRRNGVRIGAGCYIGPNSVVSQGNEIGDRAVIGAGSLVNRSIPSLEFWGGSPIKHLGNLRLDTPGHPMIELKDGRRVDLL